MPSPDDAAAGPSSADTPPTPVTPVEPLPNTDSIRTIRLPADPWTGPVPRVTGPVAASEPPPAEPESRRVPDLRSAADPIKDLASAAVPVPESVPKSTSAPDPSAAAATGSPDDADFDDPDEQHPPGLSATIGAPQPVAATGPVLLNQLPPNELPPHHVPLNAAPLNAAPAGLATPDATPHSTGQTAPAMPTAAGADDGADPSHGRRRSLSRHKRTRGDRLPRWAIAPSRRAAPLVSLVIALAATAMVQALSPAAQRVPTGGGRFLVAGSWAVLRPDALVGYDHWFDVQPYAWLQFGLLDRALLGGSAQSILAAFHGVLLLLALVAVALVWGVARRMGASALAAGAAATVFGIAPLAIALHTAALPVDLAVVWLLLACLAALGAPGAVTAILVGVFVALAALTEPLALLAAIAPAWMLARSIRSAAVRPASKFVGAVVGLLVVLGAAASVAVALDGGAVSTNAAALNTLAPVAAAQQSGIGVGAASAITWLTTDPLSLLIGIVAVILGVRRGRARSTVAAVVVLAVAAFLLLGNDGTTVPALLLPLFALATAIAIDRAVVALGRPTFVVSLAGAGWLMGVSAMLVLAAGVWLGSFGGLVRSANQPEPQAAAWVRASVPAGQLVLVDLAAWPDLASTAKASIGWYAGSGGTVASSAPWSSANYIVADSQLSDHAPGTAGTVLKRSLPAASFGTGTGLVQIRAVQTATMPTGPVQSTPAEQRAAAARRTTGAELAKNPRLTVDGADRARLLAGQVDSRVALVLGQLLAMHRVTVTSFPTIATDNTAVRRQVVISALDGHRIPVAVSQTGVVLRYLTSLRGSFAVERIDATSSGVMATFTPDPTFVPSS